MPRPFSESRGCAGRLSELRNGSTDIRSAKPFSVHRPAPALMQEATLHVAWPRLIALGWTDVQVSEGAAVARAKWLSMFPVAGAAVGVGLIGAYLFTYQRSLVPLLAQAPRAGSMAPADLDALSNLRLFFGHQSVGDNIIDGLRAVYAESGRPSPPQWSVAHATNEGGVPRGYLADAHIGRNGDATGKIVAFDELMRSGYGDVVDVALMKLCYADFGLRGRPRRVFTTYQQTMAALEGDYPRVRFIYATVPLEAHHGLRSDLRNLRRTQFNAYVRTELGNRPVFDIAAVESTDAAGNRSLGTRGARQFERMQVAFSADGGHLNAEGSRRAAAELIALVATS